MSYQVVVMGVAGSGKSTVGEQLADALGVPFVDGDDLHPAANIAKMAAGHPLDDHDRLPWLATVGSTHASSGDGVVVACSALRLAYRDLIRGLAPYTFFVYLEGSREVLFARLRARRGHFMPAALLDSQLHVLESLQSAEPGVTVAITLPVHAIVGAALAEIERIERG